jgi:hypothetical protein
MISPSRWLWCVSWLAGTAIQAQPIIWSSSTQKSNNDSLGSQMDAGFNFQLGVFRNGFTPNLSNLSQWPAHWAMAGNTTYNVSASRFSGQINATNNQTFAAGTPAWVFGFRDTSTGSEWILFRHTTWLWPQADPMNPFPLSWSASAANQVVIGNIQPTGSLQMTSAEVKSWTQWQTAELTGESANGPNHDPDGDGIPNLIEFALATPPRSGPTTPAIPVTRVDGRLEMSVPRKIGRMVNLSIEVSGNLTDWQSGPGITQEISNTPTALTVRDVHPDTPLASRRFIRLRATLPTP